MRILITGCTSGIGRTLHEHLRQRDTGNFDSYNPPEVIEVLGIGLGGPDLEQDFRAPNVLVNLRHWMQNQKPFDVLINNAAIMIPETFEQYGDNDFLHSLHANLAVPFCLMREFVRQDPDRRGRRIINVTSMVTRRPSRECPGYVASKAGLEALTRAAAQELAGKGFICCTISPGGVIKGTTMQEAGVQWLMRHRQMNPQDAVSYQQGNPLGRYISHEELIRIFKFAIFQMPEAMTGCELTIPMGSGL